MVIYDNEVVSFKQDEEKNVEEQKVVGKFGGKTGLTFGTVNEVKSVVRSTGFMILDALAWEICVVGSGSHSAFSSPRDSGSAVWDLRRVGYNLPRTTSLDRIIRDLEAEGG